MPKIQRQNRALQLRRSASAVYPHAQGQGFYGASDKKNRSLGNLCFTSMRENCTIYQYFK
jgi:hypothetical protein